MDAVAAFFNGIPKEVIYLRIPEGMYVADRTPRTVLLVNKSLYGLKQSPRCWYDELRAFLDTINFKSSVSDPCLFISRDKDHPCFVHVHVDDMTIVGKLDAINAFKTLISQRFEMEDLGEARDILGMSITRDRHLGSLSLSQSGYVNALLLSYDMINCKPVSTPMKPGTYLSPASPQELIDFAATGHNYRRAIGSLNYLVQCTRPDLAFACPQLSQYLDSPGTKHWAAFWRVLRYLQGTQHFSITFQRPADSDILIATSKNFVDSDWAGDPHSRRSTTGYVFSLYGGAIAWMSRKQPTVSLSSTEAEYKATVEGGKELAWLRVIFNDLCVDVPDKLPICNDNQGSIALADNPVFQARSKHIEVQYHWIREQIAAGNFELFYVPTREMHADLLTKALPRVLHESFCEKIGLQG